MISNVKLHYITLLSLICVFPVSGQNLITNGDFSSVSFTYGNPWPTAIYENLGFSSDYSARVPSVGSNPSFQGSLTDEGTFAIATNPHNLNGNFLSFTGDVTGEGNMLVINGAVGASAFNNVVWRSGEITVANNTPYDFSAWVINVNNVATWPTEEAWKASQAILEFQVYDNGTWVDLANIFDLTDLNSNPNSWQQIANTWNSGSNTTTELRLVNLQTSAYGNDFALDSLSFVAVPEPSIVMLLGPTIILATTRSRRS